MRMLFELEINKFGKHFLLSVRDNLRRKFLKIRI